MFDYVQLPCLGYFETSQPGTVTTARGCKEIAPHVGGVWNMEFNNPLIAGQYVVLTGPTGVSGGGVGTSSAVSPLGPGNNRLSFLTFQDGVLTDYRTWFAVFQVLPLT